MGLYLQLGDNREEPEDLASISGWGDVGRWAESLPPHTADCLLHLCTEGWEQNIPGLKREVTATMKSHPPASDVAITLENMLAVLDAAGDALPYVNVTNGMIEADEDDEEAEDEDTPTG